MTIVTTVLQQIAEPFAVAHQNIDTAHQQISSVIMQTETGRLVCTPLEKVKLVAMLAIVQIAHEVFAKTAASLRALSKE